MNQELENFKKKEITENEKSLTEVNNLEKWKKNSKNFNYSKRDENHQKECKDVFNEKSDLEDNLVVNLNSVVVKKNNLENESTKVVGSEKKKNLNEPQKRKWKLRKNQIFSIFDSVIAIFVIGPVCIGFWCSLWNLLNLQEENKFFFLF
ncbi:uncharacterized protein LOC127277732 [Leptopilina boulardi]|uniref:uncharacterized protein LOC127277732 n=1 Tax=Leptopilina boulardi TaxID=63433 RepID=UPI0021F54693|nr:uncharacterized protein LOC127277732 [Leptopilina boulardi]